jgi:trehalose 2-sulfotransferase
MMPSRGYLLCCIERTGSNLLAEALAGTGIAGQPVEYFNPAGQQRPWMRGILGDSTLVDGFSKILAAGTTPNGVFGVKVHWSHFRHLGMSVNGEWDDSQRGLLLGGLLGGPMHQLLRSRLPDLLPPAAAYELLRSRFSDLRPEAIAYAFLRSRFPDLRVIWLRRRNMVARAISDFRARKTGAWYLSNGDRVPSEHVDDFDLAEIHNLYCIGSFQEELLQQFFEEHQIFPHRVIYEELVADYELTVRRVLEFLGLDSEEPAISSPTSRKQSDGLSEEWEERYRKLSAESGL